MIGKSNCIFKANRIKLNNKYVKLFLQYLTLSIIIYFPKIYMELPNPDAIWNSNVYKNEWAWECALGRYMIGFLQYLRGYVINTGFITIVCLVLVSLVCVYIVKLFKINIYIYQILIGSLIIISPTVGNTLTYYYCSDMYMLSYFFSVISVWYMTKHSNRISLVFSSILIMISAAIYQAYIGVTISVCFLYMLVMIIDEKFNWNKIYRQALRFVGGGATGILLYLLSNRIVQYYFGISAVDSRGFSQMGKIELIKMPELINKCFFLFYEYFISDSMINNIWGMRKEINFIFFICFLIVIFIFIYQSKIHILRKIFFLLMLMIFPVMLMSIVVYAPATSVLGTTGILMLPTMNYAYVIIIMLLNAMGLTMRHREFLCFISCVSCLLVFGMLLNLELASQTYMKHNMRKTNAIAGEILNAIEDKIDNSKDYKVCIIGDIETGNYPELYPDIRNSLHWVTPYYKMIWSTFDGTQSCWKEYIMQYYGKSYEMCTWKEYQEIRNDISLVNMSNFPDKGSVEIRNSIIVIKLSNKSWE